ncbi:hypothetical protein Scep_016675 [Stephania cephalantha]|uniref:Uncharacterized protein n=1 Tax=Stephania cephalantha TaxID=152367 RepID=A0AAP0NSV3_9MAGN
MPLLSSPPLPPSQLPPSPLPPSPPPPRRYCPLLSLPPLPPLSLTLPLPPHALLTAAVALAAVALATAASTPLLPLALLTAPAALVLASSPLLPLALLVAATLASLECLTAPRLHAFASLECRAITTVGRRSPLTEVRFVVVVVVVEE